MILYWYVQTPRYPIFVNSFTSLFRRLQGSLGCALCGPPCILITKYSFICRGFQVAEFKFISIIEITPFLVRESHSCTIAVFTNTNKFDKMPQKTVSTVETYNFLLHAIFYRSVHVGSFECTVWKKLADYFVVWKLEHVSNFFIGWFFIWQCAYAHLIPRL